VRGGAALTGGSRDRNGLGHGSRLIVLYWGTVFASGMKRPKHRRKRLRLKQVVQLALFALGFLILSLAGIYLGVNYKH